MSEKEYSIDPELMREFLDETTESLSPLENLLIKLEDDPENIDLVNSVFRPIHSLKGTAAFFKLMKTRDLSHAIEDLLDLVRKKRRKAGKEVVRAMLDGLDMLRKILARVRANAAGVKPQPQLDLVLDALKLEVDSMTDFDRVLTALKKLSAEEVPAPPDIAGIVGAALSMLADLRQWLPSDKTAIADEITKLLAPVSPPQPAPQADSHPDELLRLL